MEPIPSVSIALTLLDAILLGALEILILLLAGDALNALIVVVLVGSADGGVGAHVLCFQGRGEGSEAATKNNRSFALLFQPCVYR